MSYVWGPPSVPQLKLTEQTQARLTTDGGLGKQWADVPQTIRYAMLLYEILSIRYLWVDAMCLEQSIRDHVSGSDSQLSAKMGHIYGAAHITIVSAAGQDSLAGLPRLRRGSRSVLQRAEIKDDSAC